MKIHSVWDNGGKTCDRYTVYYKGRGSLNHTGNGSLRLCLGMSEHPSHPCGVGQHGYGYHGRHNGKRIAFEDLPPDCQKAVLNDLRED